MSDDDTTAFDTFDPADGDEPAPEFVEELLGQLEVKWHSRADGHGTDPSADPIDVAVFDQGNEPMGRNRLTALVAAAAAIVVVIVGLVVITNDDDEDTTIDPVGQTETTDPPPDETATEEPEPDWSFDVTYIEVDNDNPDLDFSPGGVTANDEFAWVIGGGTDSLHTIDLETNTVVSTAEIPLGTFFVGDGFGSVWLGHIDGTMSRFDPQTGTITATIEIGAYMSWIDGGADSVWLAAGQEAVRVDPATNTVAARVPIGADVGIIHENADGAWLRDLQGRVHRIDPATNTVVAVIDTPTWPSGAGLIAGDGAVWAPGGASGSVYRIDPATNTVATEIQVEATEDLDVWGPNVTGGSLWVSYGCRDTEGSQCTTNGVARIDPETNEVVATVELRAGWAEGNWAVNSSSVFTPGPDAIARIDF